MATLTRDDENLAETNEVLYENANMIDNEPLYRNFAAIQNDLRHYNEHKQLNTSFYLTNKKNHTDRVQTECFHYNELNDINYQNSTKTNDDGMSNLIRIIVDIGCDPQTPAMHSSQNNNTYNSNQGHQSIVNNQLMYMDQQYCQNGYLNRYHRSTSMIRYYPINHNYQSQNNIQPSVPTDAVHKQTDDTCFEKNVSQMYGFDDGDTISSASSSCSSFDDRSSPTFSDRSSSPRTLQTSDNCFKPKQITIREYYPRKDLQSLLVNGSSSPSSQQICHDNYYNKTIHNHPNICKDSNPNIIRKKSNPEEVVYKQSVSVRFLVPPTPPPPGPLIIREILPPRPPSPPPFVIRQQEPTPPTPSPLILREIPPPPPPKHEPKIITKVLPPQLPPQQRVITEQNHPLPPKPQSIILEKWLPYKPAPPREVIYERLVEPAAISEFEPTGMTAHREHQNSNSKSMSRFPIPVHIEQQHSFDYFGNKQSLSAFDQLARSTQHQLEAMQQQVVKQIHAQQQWLANQQQQHMNMCCMQMPLQLTTPALVINHPPTTRTTNTYEHSDMFQQQLFCTQPFLYPSFI